MRLIGSSESVHILCAALVAADIAARTVRVRIILRALGARISRWDAAALTSFGDAAAAITPWRAGGDVARVIGGRASGAPVATLVATMAIETTITYCLALVVGLWLGSRYGGDWLARARATTTPMSAMIAGFITAALVLAVIVVAVVPAARHQCRTAVSAAIRALSAARRVSLPVVATSVLLSVLSLAARVAVLPLLAMTANDTPFGALTLASFALLHAQIAIPTPAGAGAIELAFLGGGVGLSGDVGHVLGWWRLYMTAIPIATGLTLGGAVFGRRALDALPSFFARPSRAAHTVG